jgi:lipopolysaccharide export system permease protein
MYVHSSLAPTAHLRTKQTIAELSAESPVELIEEGKLMPDFVDGITLYVGKKNKDVLQDVRIFDSTAKDFTREIKAQSATITIEEDDTAVLHLFNVSVTPFARGKPDPAYADEWPLRLKNVSSQKTYTPKEDDFTFGELLARIGSTSAFYPDLPEQRIPIQNMILRVELNKRICLSLACIAFVILGIPLGIKAHRRESSVGVGLSLVLVVNLYVFVVIAESLAKQPPYHADLIVWTPIVLSVLIGSFMLNQAN